MPKNPLFRKVKNWMDSPRVFTAAARAARHPASGESAWLDCPMSPCEQNSLRRRTCVQEGLRGKDHAASTIPVFGELRFGREARTPGARKSHPSPCRNRHTDGPRNRRRNRDQEAGLIRPRSRPRSERRSAAPHPRNQERIGTPQTARPRHTPARPEPNPRLKEKLPEHHGNQSTYPDPHPFPDRTPWPAQKRARQLLCSTGRRSLRPSRCSVDRPAFQLVQCLKELR